MAATEMTAGRSLEAVQAMPEHFAMMKLENDTIQSMALARPRDHARIKAAIAQQINAYPSFAESVVYCKPVGKDDDGRMKYARGLSIRAAEALAEAYGYCRVRSSATPLPDGNAFVEATFTDYQSGRIWQDGGVVSRHYKTKRGAMAAHPEDRFWNVVVKAEVSRRIREVITRSVPPGLRAELQEMAERAVAKLLTPEKMSQIVRKFSQLGVTIEQLEQHVGRTQKVGWTEQDRLDLLGIYQAIQDGETTASEAFSSGTESKPDVPVKNAANPIADALTQPTEVAEEKPGSREAAIATAETETAPAKPEPTDFAAIRAGFAAKKSVTAVNLLLTAYLEDAKVRGASDADVMQIESLADQRCQEIQEVSNENH